MKLNLQEFRNEEYFNTLFLSRQTRSTFDTAEVKRSFGPVTIEYGKVQSKVSLKYDSWHKDALAKFSALLSSQMITFHTEVAKVRFCPCKF